MIAVDNSYRQNMTYIGRTWFILAYVYYLYYKHYILFDVSGSNCNLIFILQSISVVHCMQLSGNTFHLSTILFEKKHASLYPICFFFWTGCYCCYSHHNELVLCVRVGLVAALIAAGEWYMSCCCSSTAVPLPYGEGSVQTSAKAIIGTPSHC